LKNLNNLYNESYPSLKKEIKEDIRRWKDILCSRIGRINIVKMPTTKTTCMLNEIPIKVPMTFFKEIKKSILKFLWKHKTLNSQINLEQKCAMLEISQ
jgi:hypothetical protein